MPIHLHMKHYHYIHRKEGNKDSLLYKLRWVTLGYHYDWSSKLYHTDCYSPFPTDLSLLTQFILKALGFDQFKAQAAIVNYYHLDSTLSGHTDHSESDLTAPLISLRYTLLLLVTDYHTLFGFNLFFYFYL